ncbi:hypothetical protein [Oceanospirillum maris]|uniref:hypothetical protein n=1 Tax=Oceanospirillum maris TaxID=64977 RepID=UPI0003FD0D4F|nr:hypothetical protein [Oceanospirillum maris]
MKDQKRDNDCVQKSVSDKSAREKMVCDVCISQGAPCAAMTQMLFTGKSEQIECDLMKHCF